MSTTVAAALKKIAVAVLSDKKGRKIVLGIILGVLVIVFLPLAAILGMFSGDITVDTDRLVELVQENLSEDELSNLQAMQDTMTALSDAMTEAGFSGRISEAEVLYTLALSDFATEADFVATLVGCFAENQTDAELIAAVNAAFGTSISPDDFSQLMNPIRAVYIDTSGYIDPASKNNLDLVQWAIVAEKAGWGYVWGTYGQVLTKDLLNAKLEQYPDELSDLEDFIRENWLFGRTADCVGLIKGYGWFDPETGEIGYGTNGMPDIGSDTMYANASEKGTIDTIPEIPGLGVWKAGHIGIYIGNGEVIEAMGTYYGVVRSTLSEGTWTHWLKIPYLTYLTDVTASADEAVIWNILYNEIGNAYGVAGVMGNLFAESGLRANNLQDSYESVLGFTDASYTLAVDDGTYGNFASDFAGYGLAQWTTQSRKAALLAFAAERGCSVSDAQMQAEFLCWELRTSFPSVLSALQNATSVREASDVVLFRFEAPANQGEAVQQQRAAFAEVYFERYGGESP